MWNLGLITQKIYLKSTDAVRMSSYEILIDFFFKDRK